MTALSLWFTMTTIIGLFWVAGLLRKEGEMIEFALERKDGRVVKVKWVYRDGSGLVRRVNILEEFDDDTSRVESLDFPFKTWHKKPGTGRRGEWVDSRTAIVSDSRLWMLPEDGVEPQEGDQLIRLDGTAPTAIEAELVA